jgi:hypothetical protein
MGVHEGNDVGGYHSKPFGVFWGAVFVFALARTLHLLGRCSHSCSPFCSGYFGDRVWIFVQVSQDHHSMLSFPLLLG